MTRSARPDPRDRHWFRRVLGQFPTGVTVVTAAIEGRPVGMVVGSFTSVSLNPPLVAFLPGKESRTWPRIQAAGSFCVNVLGAAQESVCHAMLSGTDDKFAGLEWRPSESTGSPALGDAVAWIDCHVQRVFDAGDHWIVIGEVTDLDLGDQNRPLLFFRGSYGSFEPPEASTHAGHLAARLHEVSELAGSAPSTLLASPTP